MSLSFEVGTMHDRCTNSTQHEIHVQCSSDIDWWLAFQYMAHTSLFVAQCMTFRV